MKNNIGVYYGFLTDSDQVDWIKSLYRARKAGMDILEVSAYKLQFETPEYRHRIAELAKELGMGITSATGLPPEGDLTSEFGMVQKHGVELLKAQIDLIAEMGGTLLGGILVGVGKSFPPGIENKREKTAFNAVEPLREIAEYACDAGVVLGLEVVNRFESPLLNTAEEAMRLVEAVDRPGLGILLDTFHMNIEEASMGEAVRCAGRRLVHFHACENNRMVPGRGHVNWDDIFSALRDINYQDALVMEALPGPYGSVAGRLNIWRMLSTDVDGELMQAAHFLREKGDQYGI